MAGEPSTGQDGSVPAKVVGTIRYRPFARCRRSPSWTRKSSRPLAPGKVAENELARRHDLSLIGARYEHSGPRRIAIVALITLDLTFLINALDRQVLPVLLPDIRQEYQLTAAATGLLSTVFTLGLGFAGLASGFLADRFRRKTIILVGIAVFTVATAAQPLPPG